MNKLVNLRFIKVEGDLHGREFKCPQFKGIGQLISLQQLDTFKIENKSGWKISELGGLNNLHGKLVVRGLQNITCKEEAGQACLKRKVHLEELVLDWTEEEKETIVSSVQQEHVDSQMFDAFLSPPNKRAQQCH
ncbi:hypothetical protein Taro_031220 [Colocasia esculenta]|uniref:R13L1/DRL21-like LRR repeat region domain-containing protein n=1 Tax=Colocasia esculenta TaxID=4460 RepID=A0A843W083_COLES|nr:hypothetical protein [Colocasia esculenta]